MPSMKGACGGLGVVLGKWGSFFGGGGSLAWWVRWGVRGEVVGVTFTWWCLTSRGSHLHSARASFLFFAFMH